LRKGEAMSIQAEIDRLSSAKESIIEAIEGRGVSVPEGTKADGLAEYIDSIGEAGFSGDYTVSAANQIERIRLARDKMLEVIAFKGVEVAQETKIDGIPALIALINAGTVKRFLPISGTINRNNIENIEYSFTPPESDTCAVIEVPASRLERQWITYKFDFSSLPKDAEIKKINVRYRLQYDEAMTAAITLISGDFKWKSEFIDTTGNIENIECGLCTRSQFDELEIRLSFIETFPSNRWQRIYGFELVVEY